MSQPNLADDSDDLVLNEEQPGLDTQTELETGPEPEPADIPTQKRKTDIYTVMLIISFVCVVTACILLAWELSKWGDLPKPWNTSEGIPNRVSEFVPTHSIWTEGLV